MTISLKHKFASLIPDAGDSTIVQPSNWNDEHALTQATSTILGRVSALTGATEELTPAQTRALLNVADGADVTATALNATAKAAPVDADRVYGGNSAASFGLVYATWTQTKAFLKTYFDTLYQPLLASLTSWGAITRAAGFDAFAATPSSANLRALLTDEVGTGAAYFVGGALGTPASGIATNLTGLPVASGISGLAANMAAFLAGGTSAQLIAAVTDETGTGSLVFATSPAFAGTPTAPTAAVDTNTTQLATTAMVLAQSAAAAPLGNAPTAVVGTSTRFARADHVHPGREVLTAARTYYVLPTGSDSNTGLVNTAGGAFLTIQKAIDVVAALDLSIYSVTIQVGDGTYTGAIVSTGARLGAGSVTLQGNAATPANVLISTGANDCIIVQQNSSLIVKDMKMTSTGSHAIYCKTGAYCEYTNIDFGAVAVDAHVFAEDGGAVTCTGNYAISGGSGNHWRVSYGVIRCQSKTVTITGTPNFTTAFATGRNAGDMVINSNTFSGAATGVRYDATLNSVIQTAGGGATYLPGNAVGTTATGGQYA